VIRDAGRRFGEPYFWIDAIELGGLDQGIGDAVGCSVCGMISNDSRSARLTVALNDFRLPAIKALWPRFAERADKEGWRAARLITGALDQTSAAAFRLSPDFEKDARWMLLPRRMPGPASVVCDHQADFSPAKASLSRLIQP